MIHLVGSRECRGELLSPYSGILLLGIFALQAPCWAQTPAPVPTVLGLDACLSAALQNSHRRPVSRFAVAMAEAQHRQTLAGYWPQASVKGSYQRLDEPMNFLFPASVMPIPGQTVTVPGGTAMVTIPANAFGPGFPPANLQMPVAFPGQTVSTPSQAFGVPQQDVKILDRDWASGTLEMKWLLFDGGMRSGYRQQAAAGVDVMKEAARRTDLEVADSVRRMYWGAVLARQLHRLGKDTVVRMETTLKLTETLFKEGAGKVNKADFLDNQVMVDSLRAMVAQLEKNETMAQAALANTMGLPWSASVEPASAGLPFQPVGVKAEDLVASAWQFNPDWKQLDAGIRAAEGGVKTARSGYYPKVALIGELRRIWNGGFEQGLSTPQNRTGWSAGVGVEFPLFDGFLTRNKVSEMVARLEQLKETRFLLKEGLGLQVKDLVLTLVAAEKTAVATESAMKSAEENRDLNTRAYQNELVETEKVIRAQLMEALMSAQHFKARYDYLAVQSQLNLVVGAEVRAQLRAGEAAK